MAALIEPELLKGFRDYLPELMIPREQLLEKVRQVYRSYGFAPIDTPALEYTPKSCWARAARNPTSSSTASAIMATATWPCAST